MSTSEKQKAKQPEIIDATGDSDASDNHSDSEGEDHVEGTTLAGENAASSTSTAQKKKKKKKSKAKKLFNAIRGKDSDEIPQEVVDQVLDKVKAEGGPGAMEANADNVREALQQLKIMDVVKGKAGIGGLNRKDMGEHKVCLLAAYADACLLTYSSSFGQRNLSHN